MGNNRKKSNRKRKQEAAGKKETPIGVTLLLILLVSALFILFCGATGVMIDAIIAFSTGCVKPEETGNYLWRIVPVGIIYIFFFIVYCLDGIPGLKKSKEESFREDILGMFLIVMGFAGVVLMALAAKYDRDMSGIIGMLIYPAIGIGITPKIVKKSIMKMRKWEDSKNILTYSNKDENLYSVKTPVAFEKRLFFEVVKYQFGNLFLAIGLVIVMIVVALNVFSGSTIRSGSFAGRAALSAIASMIGIGIFGIPIAICFLTKSIYKLRLVKKHKYQAYHVIAKSANDKVLLVEIGGYFQKVEYPVCVGIRKKEVHDTKATLIFLPDTAMLFPDKKFDK